jgi:hypothetical protein
VAHPVTARFTFLEQAQGMGRRLPRQTARKSTGERRLPDKTNNARDRSEDGNEEVRGTAARGPPRPPAAGAGVRAVTSQRQNERHEFECFFEKFGLTGRLTKTEIEEGSNCMFLGLADQMLDHQKPAPNTFCPITHAHRKVKVMSIRNVTVDYIKSNRTEFEGWLSYPSDRDFGDDDFFYRYCENIRTEGQQGDALMLKAAALGLQVDIQVFKFNTITDSICMYHFPREKPSEDRASQISIPREPDAVGVGRGRDLW